MGASEDLIFSPYFDHERVGTRTFSNTEGIGFAGVAYRGINKQTVSGSISSRQTLVPNVTSPNLAHYRFAYDWEWFPPRWLLLSHLGFDNYSASRIGNFQGTLGDFNQTHNDLSGGVTVRRGFNQFSVGLTLGLEFRFDAEDSLVYNTPSAPPLDLRRNDRAVEIQPHVIWRVQPQTQLMGYFRYSRVRSTISPTEIGFNLAHDESVVGVMFNFYGSSY